MCLQLVKSQKCYYPSPPTPRTRIQRSRSEAEDGSIDGMLRIEFNLLNLLEADFFK